MTGSWNDMLTAQEKNLIDAYEVQTARFHRMSMAKVDGLELAGQRSMVLHLTEQYNALLRQKPVAVYEYELHRIKMLTDRNQQARENLLRDDGYEDAERFNDAHDDGASSFYMLATWVFLAMVVVGMCFAVVKVLMG